MNLASAAIIGLVIGILHPVTLLLLQVPLANKKMHFKIFGLEGYSIQRVTFKKCTLKAQKGLVIEHARKVDLSGLLATVTEGELVNKKNVE